MAKAASLAPSIFIKLTGWLFCDSMIIFQRQEATMPAAAKIIRKTSRITGTGKKQTVSMILSIPVCRMVKINSSKPKIDDRRTNFLILVRLFFAPAQFPDRELWRESGTNNTSVGAPLFILFYSFNFQTLKPRSPILPFADVFIL